MKTKLLICAAVAIGVIFVSGVTMLAATTGGTEADPLVTLSYLTNIFKPKVTQELDAKIAEKEAELTRQFNEQIAQVSQTPATQPGTAADTEDFVLITLSKNSVLKCGIGTQLLLRTGTAEAAGSNPAIIDATDGSELKAKSEVQKNHLYMVSIENNGLKATADAKILICGPYTISK